MPPPTPSIDLAVSAISWSDKLTRCLLVVMPYKTFFNTVHPALLWHSFRQAAGDHKEGICSSESELSILL